MKNGKRMGLFTAVLLCMLLLAGCKAEKETAEGVYSIYYLDTEENQLVKEYCEEEAEDVDGRIEEVLELLEKEPEELSCKSVFSGGVEAVDWELHETKLMLHFNREYQDLAPDEEVFLRAAVVQSLVQISGVDYVCFFVEDAPLLLRDGSEVGYMREEDFVQNTGSSLHSYQTADLTLYFASGSGDKLTPEKINVRYNSNMSVEKLIVEQLIKGPSLTGNKAILPAETKVLGVSVKDKVCYVNFDEAFLNVVPQVNPKVTVYALVNSIIDGGEAAQVQILVNGETNVTYQETVDLSKPFSRNAEIEVESK